MIGNVLEDLSKLVLGLIISFSDLFVLLSFFSLRNNNGNEDVINNEDMILSLQNQRMHVQHGCLHIITLQAVGNTLHTFLSFANINNQMFQ